MQDIIRIIRDRPLLLVVEFAALCAFFAAFPFAMALIAMATGHF